MSAGIRQSIDLLSLSGSLWKEVERFLRPAITNGILSLHSQATVYVSLTKALLPGLRELSANRP